MSGQSAVSFESSVRCLNVLHVISGLGAGGAESMLYRLIKENQEQGMHSAVICLGEESFVADKIRALNVEILNLELHKHSIFNLPNLRRIIQISHRVNPDVVQGWMYHGNCVATVIKLVLARKSKLFWNIRQTVQSLSNEKRLTRWVIRINSLLSRWTDCIIYNSTHSRIQHESFGFNKSRGSIVYNGISLEEYCPSASISSRIKADLGIGETAVVIGHVARYHPKKDHLSLIKTLADPGFENMEIVFLLVGKNVDSNNRDLQHLLLDMGLNEKIMLLGEREDVPNLLKCMDILISSSAWGEGFPNVLIEAMATEVYCIATNVGESETILADCGSIVPPKNVPALTRALLTGITLPAQYRESIGRRARENVRRHYSISAIGHRYRQLYMHAIGGDKARIDC